MLDLLNLPHPLIGFNGVSISSLIISKPSFNTLDNLNFLFGGIKNLNYADKYYKIYSDGNYNRYVYKSLYKIDLNNNNITDYERKVIEIFNVLLFKGSRNVKRYNGITELPKWIKNNKHMDFVKFFRELFISKFK